MSRDWLKIRHGLGEDPKVVAIAAALGESERYVVGLLVELWTWAEQQLDEASEVPDGVSRSKRDMVAHGVSREWLERRFGTPRLCEILESVGWFTSNGDTIAFPGLAEHTGVSAKKRAQAARRKRNERKPSGVSRSERDSRARARGRASGLSVNTQINTQGGEKKRRRETTSARKTTVAREVELPPELATDEFRAVWSDWLDARAERRKPVTPRAARMQLGKLAPFGPVAAREAIEMSIANDWLGLFPEKTSQHGAGNGTAGRRNRGADRSGEFAENIELPVLDDIPLTPAGAAAAARYRIRDA